MLLLGLLVIGLMSLAILDWMLPEPARFRSPAENRDILIAHAGGGLGELTYTNAREALETSIAAGFKFIELDLLLTCDGHLAAAHDWALFNKITGAPESRDCLSLAEFRSRRLHGEFGVLGAAEINEIFARHQDVHLVTDKIRDFGALTGQLSLPPERMLVEVSSYKQYRKALAAGLKYPVLAFYSLKRFKRLKYQWLFRSGKISLIALPEKMLPQVEEDLAELYQRGITIFVFTSNDPARVRQVLNRSVSGYYTDFLKPGDLSPPANP